MNQHPSPSFDTDQEKVLDSIRPGKIIIPTLIGLTVVIFLVRRQLNLEEVFEINWNAWSYLWILIAIFVYCGRHLLYSLRLRLLSEGDFSWGKSIELTTILEFASAVSPTNFGGSAVAFFLLIQENIAAARATAIVIYTIIADTLFFVFTLPILWLIFGSEIFVPPVEDINEWDSLGITLFAAWALMAIYGVLLLYGLFVEPKHLKRLLRWFASWKILRKSKDRILGAADDIEVSSLRIQAMPKRFHFSIAGITLLAWIFRFFAVTAILIALNTDIVLKLYDHLVLLGRGEGLYAVTAYSPTPGGSGVAEIIFGQFYKEYVTPGIAVVAAVLWRVITYYPYLILGVIIIPNWIRKLINKRRVNKENKSHD
jgi:uncharacterized protein (TIRG00374 family)